VRRAPGCAPSPSSSDRVPPVAGFPRTRRRSSYSSLLPERTISEVSGGDAVRLSELVEGPYERRDVPGPWRDARIDADL
jgi:hypothetical protein